MEAKWHYFGRMGLMILFVMVIVIATFMAVNVICPPLYRVLMGVTIAVIGGFIVWKLYKEFRRCFLPEPEPGTYVVNITMGNGSAYTYCDVIDDPYVWMDFLVVERMNGVTHYYPIDCIAQYHTILDGDKPAQDDADMNDVKPTQDE